MKLFYSISVIIPALNEINRLPRTLQTSLEYLNHEAHRDDPWEVILVDDGSDDGTAAFAATLIDGTNQLRVLRSEANRGKGAALAAGAERRRRDIGPSSAYHERCHSSMPCASYAQHWHHTS